MSSRADIKRGVEKIAKHGKEAKKNGKEKKIDDVDSNMNNTTVVTNMNTITHDDIENGLSDVELSEAGPSDIVVHQYDQTYIDVHSNYATPNSTETYVQPEINEIAACDNIITLDQLCCSNSALRCIFSTLYHVSVLIFLFLILIVMLTK